MATTFVLVHGAGGTGAYWQRLVPLLRAAGHRVVAPDLPNHPGVTFPEQADAVVAAAEGAAAEGAADVVLVAQSMGAYAAVLACSRLPVRRLVLLNPMIPAVGESAGAWWERSGQVRAREENDRASGRDPSAGIVAEVHLLHDVDPDVLARLEGDGAPAASLFEAPPGLDRMPEVGVSVLSGRDDRLFPLAFQRRLARERLGVEVVEVPGGHLAALTQPDAVASALLRTSDPAATPGG